MAMMLVGGVEWKHFGIGALVIGLAGLCFVGYMTREKPLEDISPNLIAAVIDHEDAKFYEHRGFDWDAISYAYEQNQRYGRIVCGGSTISQQTAKNIFTFHSRTYLRKAVEAYFTILMELLWSKELILEVYLNMIEMGDGVFGAEAAADYYFSTSAAGLTRYDANYLAARLPDPRR